MKNFSEENGFDGYFKVSAKTGKNIEESMSFLIKNIINKLEEFKKQGNTVKNCISTY